MLTAAVLPGGLLGDRYGRKKVLLAGLLTFGFGSIAVAFSRSPGAFIAARVLLGIGAAVVIPLSLSALTVLFSDEERPRAVGIWAAGNFVALPLGPILGGWLLTNYWWGWVFLLNLPVVIIGVIAVAVLVPESRSAERPPLDLVGVAASSAGLTALIFGFIQAGQNGWGNPLAIGAMASGLVVLAAFVLWEWRLGQRAGSGGALVDVALFRAPAFAWGTILAALAIFAMFGILFSMPMFFQAVSGTDAMGSGLRLLPLIGGLVLDAGGLSRLAVPAGPKLTVASGLALLAAGLGFGATTGASSSLVFIALWTGAAGVGMGLALATATSGALGELSQERAGVGAAVMQAVQKVGAPLAAAILGASSIPPTGAGSN
ncbi:MAG: MFS transporter [Candidatus Dormibacteria bacterium]